MSWASIAKNGILVEQSRLKDRETQKALHLARQQTQEALHECNEAIKRERKLSLLQNVENKLVKNFERFIKQTSGNPCKIISRSNAVDYVYHGLLKTSKIFNKLPHELILLIIDFVGDDGVSPLAKVTNNDLNSKRLIPIGKSIMGIPYGVWRIYTLCGYNISPSKCDHSNCVSNIVDVPITSINYSFELLCGLKSPFLLFKEDVSIISVILHRYIDINPGDLTREKGLSIIKCKIKKQDDYKIKLNGRWVCNEVVNLVRFILINSEKNSKPLGFVTSDYK